MPVTKNEKINFPGIQVIVTKLNQPFFIWPHEGRQLLVSLPTFTRKIHGQGNAQVGVERGKHALTKAVVEDFFQKLIAVISRPQSIAMTNKKSFSTQFPDDRFPVGRYAQFLFEIPKHPHIVVAGKEVNG